MRPALLAPIFALTVAAATLAPGHADAADPGPFAEGSLRLSIIAGAGGGFGNDYLVLGAGLGSYVLDGLEVGAEYEQWFLADPMIGKLSPQARYVLWFVPVLKPYVGTFYRHWFISDGFDDVDTVGARAGAFYVSGGGSYFGLGVVYEKILDCQGSGDDCSDVYPELVLAISL